MMDKPLPDRIRPLEGAGMKILYSNMGATPKHNRWFGPVSAVLIAAAIVYFAYEWIA